MTNLIVQIPCDMSRRSANVASTFEPTRLARFRTSTGSTMSSRTAAAGHHPAGWPAQLFRHSPRARTSKGNKRRTDDW